MNQLQTLHALKLHRRSLAQRTYKVSGKGGHGYIYVGDALLATAVYPTKREAVHAAQRGWLEVALLPANGKDWIDTLFALLNGAGGETLYANYGVTA